MSIDSGLKVNWEKKFHVCKFFSRFHKSVQKSACFGAFHSALHEVVVSRCKQIGVFGVGTGPHAAYAPCRLTPNIYVLERISPELHR